MFLSQVTSKKFWKLEIDQNLFNEQKSGVTLPQDFDTEARNRAQVRTGLGIDTEYGQWLQQVLCEGDWVKTSAIRTQQRLKPRRRADVD